MRTIGKKKVLCLSAVLVVLFALIGCGPIYITIIAGNDTSKATEETEAELSEALDSISIVYTNDTHSYINNVSEDDDDNEIKGISFANVAAYVEEKRAAGENVLLLDAGDHAQGTAWGAIDEGASIIKIMNAAGYQASAIGNHEFDYGQFGFFKLVEEADFPYLSCDFYNVDDGSLVFDAYRIFEVGNARVAVVGISTPETYTTSSPSYFQNENGEFIYGFYMGDDGRELYDSVQRVLDEVEDKADYVIGLAHLGVDPASTPYTSRDVIKNTSGFDAVIDGHSHTVMESENITDAAGNTVVLTQTGMGFESFGDMEISSDGSVTCKLVDDYDEVSPEVDALEQEVILRVQDMLGSKIAVSDVNFYIYDPDDQDTRLIRRQETNMGDVIADSIYWYINEISKLDCDVAVINGGGIRSNMDSGDVSYLSARTICPFGNVICLIDVTGRQIMDALEMGARSVGIYDSEDGEPAELGGFLHVAGLRYTVDSSIPSTIRLSSKEIYEGSPTGEYKVKNVEIYNKVTHQYEPIDPEATYTMGGIYYALRNCGDGMAMFADSKLELDSIVEDYICIAEYFKAFDDTDVDGCPNINTQTSPLSYYENYMIDYENPFGSGRITIE